jgi:hypothetical protein
MRKTTLNLILGIIIGIVISGISNNITGIKSPMSPKPPVASTINQPSTATESVTSPFNQQIAPGLQIVEVPPPLDIMGKHPYQCYMNGEPINIPKELVKQLVAKHGDPSDNDPNFNVHNFTGNLKMIDLPVGSTRPIADSSQ